MDFDDRIVQFQQELTRTETDVAVLYPGPNSFYWEFDHYGFSQAARYENWKAIRPDVGEPIELYDLDEDPSEEHDVASEHPEVITRFEWYLDHAHEPSKHWPVW